MDNKDFDTGDSWPIAFITTGICGFIFIFFLRMIDNSFPRIFLWIAISSLLLGCFSLITSIWFKKKESASEE
jgi:ABC-type multidrug transport system permease subunit